MPVDETTDLDRVLGLTRELVELVRSRGLARLAVDAGPVRWEIDGAAAVTGPAAAGPAPYPNGAAPRRNGSVPPRNGSVLPNGSVPHLNGSVTALAAEPSPPTDAGGTAVLAPLVGVFYRSPSPGAPPFVEVGQPVTAGQQLAVVEAMKMMNEVVAETAGVVREVHVADAEIVEFGQRLFTIAPA